MSTPTLHIFVSTGCANQSRKDVALFISGDSINDAGTNNCINTTADFRANFPPHGETFFHNPTGRFSDGRLIADFIAEYAKLPLIPPYLQMKDGDEFMGGANFESGRAGALVDTYKGFGIYKVGGRKFAMIGIRPLGRVPGMRPLTRSGACSGEASKLAKLHNIALASFLTKPETQLQEFKYSYFDFYTSGRERIQYPSKYGLMEAKTACCGSGLYRANPTYGGKRGVKEYLLCRYPEKYVFFNTYHPSDRTNKQFAQLLWNGSLSVIRPHNLGTLFKYEFV